MEMSKSEVIPNMSRHNTNSKFDLSIVVNDLELESYLKPDFNSYFKSEVKAKIEEFSSWFNSTARLCLLRCDPQESEVFIYLLLNLKKKLKFAISEINRSISNHKQVYTCGVCNEKIEIPPRQNLWSALQNHPHFEQTYHQVFDMNQSTSSVENEESSSNESVVDDLSEEQMILTEANEPDSSPETALNSFRFNFVVTYDKRVEESLYPDSLVTAARRRDNVSEYTVRRCGAGRAVCLLCPCSLIPKGRVCKISPYIIKNHVAGQKHLKFASSEVNINALKQYHEFWRNQEPAYQAQQVHFIPELTLLSVIRCQLCQELVYYSSIVEHIKDKNHKSKVLKILYSPEGKLNEYYLLDMQVNMYDVVNHAGKEEKAKEAKSETNGASPPKCKFVKIVADSNGLNLPPRYKEHLKFFTQNSETVTCTICKNTFSNDAAVVRNHIFNTLHKQLSGLTFPKYKFFCEICNLELKDENGWNDHFSRGPNRHDSVPPTRRPKLAEYECITCLVILFGDELSLSRHISMRNGKSGRPKDVKLPFSVRKLFKSKVSIEQDSRRLQFEANQVLEYQDKMKECCEDLEGSLAKIYPKCKAYPFGSRISGLGNNQSDLDVFMDTGDMYLGDRQQDSANQEQFVKKAFKVLKAFKEEFNSVVAIPSARTPIVKLHHNYADLDCDISFRHGLGVENTKFLRFCIDLQPITQPFILLLKRWSDYCKLNEHITNYGLALMAVFFLQTGGYLLSVKTVRNYNPTQSLVIDGWDTLNYTVPVQKMREFVKPYSGDIKQLLRDFFFYFSKFDYTNQVVCPLLGNTIPKMLFNENPDESLPVEMKSYVQRIQSENGEQFRGLTPFCIQDPFDLSHNLTKACPQSVTNKLKTLCTLTYEFMDTIE